MKNVFLLIQLIFFDVITGIENNRDNNNGPKPWPANSTICYNVEGCFSNSYPFNNSGNYLPTTPEVLNTEFLLYTRKNSEAEDILSYKNEYTIRNSKFDISLPLKIVVHGFTNNKNTTWITNLKKEILKYDNVNLILVYWGNGCVFPLYANASANTRLVGKQLGILVNLIRSILFPLNPRQLNIHCIGHSLGAHTCGYASNSAKIRFNRISALDPAGPNFEGLPNEVRIDPSDADFVDAMHTNANPNGLLSGSFGMYYPAGHVDFYVNGGYSQPGCPALTELIGSLINGSLNPSTDVGCSHNRAHVLFKESISASCFFKAYSCLNQSNFDNGDCLSCENSKCAIMGYFANEFNSRGSMYFNTMSKSPFCGYHNLFEMKINDDSKGTTGDITLNINSDSNNVLKPLSGENIKSGSLVRKIIVSSYEISLISSFELTFIRKSALISWLPNPNPDTFLMDKIKFQNSQAKIFSSCVTRTLVTTGIPKILNLSNSDCLI